jgi:16S rRNA (guanine527-N7)-methyltransferase
VNERKPVNILSNAAAIQRILEIYGYSASVEYVERVRIYAEMLLRWNQKVALTTVTNPEEIVKFHFAESLFGMIAAEIENGRLADLGSGAGFPGVPIALAKPALEVMLVESNGKKAAFLREVRRELRLVNITMCRGRAEEIPMTERFDFVAARALGDHLKWLNWSAERVAQGGKVVLWVNSDTAQDLGRSPGWKWMQPKKIPETKDRLVAVGIREEAPARTTD